MINYSNQLTANTEKSGTASRDKRGAIAPCLMTLSLYPEPSPKNKTERMFKNHISKLHHYMSYRSFFGPLHIPAIFPRAQTACSLIWACGDEIRLINAGTAPPLTTALVCSDVPDAMLVRAQAASNCMGGESTKPKKLTNFGIRPALMMRSIGGCLSRDSNFLFLKHDMQNGSYNARTSVFMWMSDQCMRLPGSLGGLKLSVQIVTVHTTYNFFHRPMLSLIGQKRFLSPQYRSFKKLCWIVQWNKCVSYLTILSFLL